MPTYFYFYQISPNTFRSNTCFSCNATDSSTHWLSCNSSQSLIQILNTSTIEVVTKTLEDLTPLQHKAIIDFIQSHPSFNHFGTFSQPMHHILITTKGLISSQLLQALQTFNIQYKVAAEIVTQILIKTSTEVYEQIWKPYCERFTVWKKQQGIQNWHIANTTQISTRRHTKNQRRKLTYTCHCGLADQLHDDDRRCPPKGQALQKFHLWSILWIQYSISYNHILTIKI